MISGWGTGRPHLELSLTRVCTCVCMCADQGIPAQYDQISVVFCCFFNLKESFVWCVAAVMVDYGESGKFRTVCNRFIVLFEICLFRVSSTLCLPSLMSLRSPNEQNSKRRQGQYCPFGLNPPCWCAFFPVSVTDKVLLFMLHGKGTQMAVKNGSR